jgi:hypothetical protein
MGYCNKEDSDDLGWIHVFDVTGEIKASRQNKYYVLKSYKKHKERIDTSCIEL